jgi:hypothetical protein
LIKAKLAPPSMAELHFLSYRIGMVFYSRISPFILFIARLIVFDFVAQAWRIITLSCKRT